MRARVLEDNTDVYCLDICIALFALFDVSLLSKKTIKDYFSGNDKRDSTELKPSILHILRVIPIDSMAYIH